MGFLIFAYRKLFLKNKISDLQFKSMMLSMKQQKVTSQIADIQESMSSAKNMVSVFANNAMAQLNQNMMGAQQYGQYGQYGQLGQGLNGSMNMDGSQNANGTQQNNFNPQAFQNFEMQRYEIAAKANACSSVFENAEKSQLTQLNALDKQITTQLASIDSQQKQLGGELDGVEKGESDAAKKNAPTFGLS